MSASSETPRQDRGAGDQTLPAIGWREWVTLPDLGVNAIKAKIDTGARTSALHAYGVRIEERDGVQFVHFRIYPVQRRRRGAIRITSPLIGWKVIRSSGGHRTRRPVVRTTLGWMGAHWPIELTLTNRDEMGFRMLLGRQAIRRHALVDPARSFIDPRHRLLERLNAQHLHRASDREKPQ
jgi:hypothetical protein